MVQMRKKSYETVVEILNQRELDKLTYIDNKIIKVTPLYLMFLFRGKTKTSNYST